MATKTRGHKAKTVAVRVTLRQLSALEKIAIQRDETISDVLREAIHTITLPYQNNSNPSGNVLPDATGIAR